ncbi:hypothetical protein AX16_000647 [Volvariella volvacea WC 439]|nr:hypothetical protein AX16_000647 [Volvariella volvacea WC 439]
MPSRKKAATSGVPQIQPSTVPAPSEAAGFFPFARYTSIVGLHTTFLAFAALFLPRTSFLFELTTPEWDPSQLTSRDKPQHPFLESLTINPAITLIYVCAGVSLLQVWWGSWVRDWGIDFALQGSLEERKSKKALLNQSKLKDLRDAGLMTLASSFVFHIALVLFGAPLLLHAFRTYTLALLVSFLVVFPPAYALGVPSFQSDALSLVRRITWVRLFAEFSVRTPIERALVYPAIGTVVGCWLGAIPIALDWDRPWQGWPLTPTFGGIAGYIMASLYALTVSGSYYLLTATAESTQSKSN